MIEMQLFEMIALFMTCSEKWLHMKEISYGKAFKMLENDMYIAGIGQAVLELLSFEVGSGNYQRGISFRNFPTSSVI